MKPKILVIDDEQSILNLIGAYLRPEGYEVYTALDGPSGLQAARAYQPDLVVLDIMLPGMDGVELLTRLRRESEVYVILLTARSDETDKIVGLSVGADDYVTKPFSPRELVARVRAVLRRSRARTDASGSAARCGDLVVAAERHEVTLRGVQVEVTPVEFDLLLTMVRSPGRVFTRRQLLEQVHGTTDYITERTIDAHVMNIRRKIEHDPRQPARLLTVYGVGYKLADGHPEDSGPGAPA